jgi:hypothetical protein
MEENGLLSHSVDVQPVIVSNMGLSDVIVPS